MRRRAGFSLAEMMMVLVVMGIAAAVAMPRLEAFVGWVRVRGAANRLAGDLAYTRQLAVRTGERAVLRLERGGGCPAAGGRRAGHVYWIVPRAGGDSVRTDLRLDAGRVCLQMNGGDTVAFNSRGLLLGFQNRTFVVAHPRAPPDTLTLSVVGRVLRRF